ncbi:hypothetical protein ANTQUA_LOCUS4843 [Anthophora quadrimaculata]
MLAYLGKLSTLSLEYRDYQSGNPERDGAAKMRMELQGIENALQGTKEKLRKEKVARSFAAPAKRGKVNGTRCLLGYPLAPCSSPVNESKLISSSA